MSLTPDSTGEPEVELTSEGNSFVTGQVIPVFGSDTIRDAELPGSWIQVALIDRDDEWIDEEVFIDAPSHGGEVADVMDALAEDAELEQDQIVASRQRCLELLAAVLESDPEAVLSVMWTGQWSDESNASQERVCEALGTSSDDWFAENHFPIDAEGADHPGGQPDASETKPDSWYTYDGIVTKELLAKYVDLVVNEGFPNEDWHFSDSRLFSLSRGLFVNAVDANGAVVFALDEANLAPFEAKFGDRIVNSSAALADGE